MHALTSFLVLPSLDSRLTFLEKMQNCKERNNIEQASPLLDKTFVKEKIYRGLSNATGTRNGLEYPI